MGYVCHREGAQRARFQGRKPLGIEDLGHLGEICEGAGQTVHLLPTKRYKPEQIMTLLRPVEVVIAGSFKPTTTA
jgi:hypothetical protein